MTSSTLPTLPDEMTPAWLTGALRKGGILNGAASVASIASQVVGEGLGFIGIVARSFDVETRRKHENDLIAEYHDQLRAGGVTGYSLEKLRDDYRACIALMSGIFIINGATLPTTNPRAVELFDQVLGRFFAAVEDQEVLSILPEA